MSSDLLNDGEVQTSEDLKKILDDHPDYEIQMFAGRVHVRVMPVQLLVEVHRLKGAKRLGIAIEFDHGRKCMSIFPERE